MSATVYVISLLLIAVAALAAGWFLGLWRSQRRLAELRDTNTELRTTLELERRNAEQQRNLHEQARTQLTDTFSALSGQALKHNSEEFLKLARENLKQFQVQAEGGLQAREKSIEQLVKPIREALQKTEAQIREIEKERKEAYGSLHRHLETMARAQESLQGETRNLVQALRRPEVRGQWGEMTLRRVVELAGMVEHCDFYEQEHVSTEEGALRPDMVVRMPDGREIVVDVKTPLDAYLSALEATDDENRGRELDRHARKVRERVNELSKKAYWHQFKSAPDFVVLFIPGEQFLSAALERDRNLLEDALRQKIILATPTSFVALLRAVAYGWRQEALAENADRIRELGEELYKRLATFTEHLSRLGKSIGSSVEQYNKAVGSLERQVLPSARRMDEMGISAKKELEPLDPLEKTIRGLGNQ
jgi:DNA recombination protein RmuC